MAIVPVHLWNLEEESGTRFDAIGGFHLNEILGPDAPTVPGMVGRAADLSGLTTYQRTPDTALAISGADEVTVMAWIQPKALPGSLGGAVVPGGSSDILAGLALDSTNHFQARYELSDGIARVLTSTPTYSLDTWYQVVFSLKRNDFAHLYVNAGTPDSTAVGDFALQSAVQFALGAVHGGIISASVYLDQVAIFDWALSPSEIDTIYNGGMGVELPYVTPVETLLPPNATAPERALEGATARIGTLSVPVHTLWSPEDCPEALLAWLAWALSVDEWNPQWTASVKRAVIAESIGVHLHKGSVASVKRALDAIGFTAYTLTEWWQPAPEPGLDGLHTGEPHTYSLGINPLDPGPSFDADLFKSVLRTLAHTAPVRSHLAFYVPIPSAAELGIAVAWAGYTHVHVGAELSVDPNAVEVELGMAAAWAGYTHVHADMTLGHLYIPVWSETWELPGPYTPTLLYSELWEE